MHKILRSKESYKNYYCQKIRNWHNVFCGIGAISFFLLTVANKYYLIRRVANESGLRTPDLEDNK